MTAEPIPPQIPSHLTAMQAKFAEEALALCYVILVAASATFSGCSLLLFPELAALSHDVMGRPKGVWASQPGRLIATPVVCAIVGTFATRHLPYGVLAILLIVIASLVILPLMKSVIAPSMSAGVLPLVLGIKSWMYPLAILAGVSALAVMLIFWKRYRAMPWTNENFSIKPNVDDKLESAPRGISWLAGFLLFVTGMGLAAQISGLRFLLFPPLIVMAYEMLGHPDICPWAKRPLTFPVACFLTATGGVLSVWIFGTGPIAAGFGMMWGVVILRIFHIHMPPALAVGLIPLVMPNPDIRYPLSVAGGTIALTCCFLASRRILNATRPAVENSADRESCRLRQSPV